MKIRITQTVEVDPEKWATEFGLDARDVRDDIRAYVRDDVKAYYAHYLQEHIEMLGLNNE